MQRSEWVRTSLAFFVLMPIVAGFTMVKTARDALFLTGFGISELSLLAIGIALLTGVVVTYYVNATRGVARNRVIVTTNIVVAISLLAFWWRLRDPGSPGWLLWALYFWSSLFSVFTVMQFWLLANDLFDGPEARRFFGILAGAAVLGGVLGGALSRVAVSFTGTEGLLVVASAFYAVGGVVSHFAWQRRRFKGRVGCSNIPYDRKDISTLRLTLTQPQVRLIAASLFLGTIATKLLDWQFKGIAKVIFAGDTDEMTKYFGSLYAATSLVSFLLQSTTTVWILRKCGEGVAILALPIGIALGALGVLGSEFLFYPVLVASSVAIVGEGGVRFAIDKAVMELFWVPVDSGLRERTKPVVDTVVDRMATGVAGCIWLALAAFGVAVEGNYAWVSIPIILVAAGWIIVAAKAHKSYRELGKARNSIVLDENPSSTSLVDTEAQHALGSLVDTKPDEPVEWKP